jgi:glycosyltransferase involved in cell wall biosynthesis
LQCTDPAEAAAASALGLRAPALVVPNGVDAARFARLPDRGALRRRLDIPPGARVLLFLGRLHRIKRPDIAVEALAAARSVPGEPVHLVLAGPDEDQLASELVAQAQRLGCAGRVHWAGLLQGDDVLHALADADLMLMPSEIQESFGMAAAEAMAAGLPVLVSDGVPVGRWAEEAGAGRRVACTAEAFARATCELLSAPGQLKPMGERGQALVRRQFDIPAVARRMLAHYQAIVKTGRPLPEATPGRDL